MFQFLIKGVFRDKNRFLLPGIVVILGVTLTVVLIGYVNGAMRGMISQNANFATGHVKVMTKAYAEHQDQKPNEMALLEVGKLVEELQQSYPNYNWVRRIHFGGLIDTSENFDAISDEVVDQSGKQGPVIGQAVDLSLGSKEQERLQIKKSLLRGKVPKNPGEIIIGYRLMDKLNLEVGDQVTFFGNTMNGSMTFSIFTISGVVRFGVPAMDRGAIIVDIKDAERLLDMEDAAGEVLGYYQQDKKDFYRPEIIQKTKAEFNASRPETEDPYVSEMVALRDQNFLDEMITYTDTVTGIFIFVFVFAMSLVLWNTGIIGALRRYKEFGIRLALGETKGWLYFFVVVEAGLVGALGSMIGTLIGLSITYYFATHGIDYSEFLENSTMLYPSIIKAEVTPKLFFIGFIPGLLAIVLGTMLSGLGIYRRQTANLIKELEV